MRDLLEGHGRGQVFNLWFQAKGLLPTKRLVAEAVTTYRHHDPDIQMPDSHRTVLEQLAQQRRLFLVTDGHKIVQAKKVQALNIEPFFAHVYITHRYGYAAMKPSPYCFDLIRRRESVDWEEMVYVGDNPAKDFVNLNRLGMQTIRVLTGQHAADFAAPGFEALHDIAGLEALPAVLETLS
jgi:putative hydrolase of the HAD superfamily